MELNQSALAFVKEKILLSRELFPIRHTEQSCDVMYGRGLNERETDYYTMTTMRSINGKLRTMAKKDTVRSAGRPTSHSVFLSIGQLVIQRDAQCLNILLST